MYVSLVSTMIPAVHAPDGWNPTHWQKTDGSVCTLIQFTPANIVPSENSVEGFWRHEGCGVDVSHAVDIELTGAGGLAHRVDGQHGVVAGILGQGHADTQRAVTVLRVLDLVAAWPFDAVAVLVPGNLQHRETHCNQLFWGEAGWGGEEEGKGGGQGGG